MKNHIEIKCSQCGNLSMKSKKEINRQKKKGRVDFFCNLSCAARFSNLKPQNRIKSANKLINLNKSRNELHQHKAHFASQMWKYVLLIKFLDELKIDYMFEKPIKKSEVKLYLFDLCLPHKNLLIEFDEKFHCGKQSLDDTEKDDFAKSLGWSVERIRVNQKEVFTPDLIIDFI